MSVCWDSNGCDTIFMHRRDIKRIMVAPHVHPHHVGVQLSTHAQGPVVDLPLVLILPQRDVPEPLHVDLRIRTWPYLSCVRMVLGLGVGQITYAQQIASFARILLNNGTPLMCGQPVMTTTSGAMATRWEHHVWKSFGRCASQ